MLEHTKSKQRVLDMPQNDDSCSAQSTLFCTAAGHLLDRMNFFQDRMKICRIMKKEMIVLLR